MDILSLPGILKQVQDDGIVLWDAGPKACEAQQVQHEGV